MSCTSNASKEIQHLLVALVSSLQTLPASQFLHSKNGRKNLFHDLLRLNSAVSSDDFDIDRIRPPLPRLASSFPQTPWLRNTSSFANSTEHRKYIDDVLREEPGPMYVGVPGFSEAFFGEIAGIELAAQAEFERCKAGDKPLYREKSGWQSWPEGAKERDVLSWFAELTGQFLDFAEEHQPTSQARRRPLAQPHRPLQGSMADRKLEMSALWITQVPAWTPNATGSRSSYQENSRATHRLM
jgi:hypothetical protein